MCAGCGHQTSVTAGTIFQGTRTPLTLWFRAIWWVVSQKNGASALGLQAVLGLGSYRTAWTWLHKIRRAMVRPGRDRLSGTVEVDETLVGGAEPGGGRRHIGKKALVAIAAEVRGRAIGRIRMRRVADASGEGGYARELTEAERKQQQQLMADTIAESDVVITTAAVPGKRAPVLIPADVVRRMHRGAVIIDLAAERGGNCELTKPDEVVVDNGVTILGPTNLPSEVPQHASQMYAKNLVTFLLSLTKEGELDIDLNDEVIRDTLAAKDGQVQSERLREMLGLEPLVLPPAKPPVDHLAEGNH